MWSVISFRLIGLLGVCWTAIAAADDGDDLAKQVRLHRDQHAAQSVELLREFMKLPNVSGDREGIRKNADFLIRQFAKKGADMELLEVPGGNPVVYGQLNSPGAVRTLVIYAHFDGQPVNPTRWVATQPFEPALYSNSVTAGGRLVDWPGAGTKIDAEWRIYGRSASDDKAPFVAMLAALDALQAADAALTCNLKFFFDGEEEIGSPNMARVLAQHRGKFDDADVWVFCDGPLHQSRLPTLYYGVRGVTGMEITVYGANRNLHSGHYGNWAPNPAMQMAQLLASMKDGDGRVLVEGFYDDVIPLTDAENAALKAVPSIDQAMRSELGLLETESQNQSYLERMQLPSLNIRGLSSASVGSTATNIVPKEAVASIDIRLAKGNHPSKMVDLVEAHIRRQGYHVVTTDPTVEDRRNHGRIAKVLRRSGYPAARTAMGHEQVQPLVERLTSFVESSSPGSQLLQIPSLGGSLPLYLVSDDLRKPLVILPLANHDNNQHAPDENLRLGNLMYGIEAMAAIFTAR